MTALAMLAFVLAAGPAPPDARASVPTEPEATPSEPTEPEATPSEPTEPEATPSEPTEPEATPMPAVGGQNYTPLPPPPPPVEPARIQPGPWRGRGWFAVRVDITVPVGGTRPGRGDAISGGGGFTLGWRLLPNLGLHAGMTTFIHDARSEIALDEFGEQVEVTGYGRLVLFDLAVLRLFLPVKGRVQPYFDAGGGVGVYRRPFGDASDAVGVGRLGLGTDFWLAPTFSLGLAADYRLLGIERSVGHTLQFGLLATVHW